MSERFDVIWIGTGQATLSTVPRIISAGKSVAVVEAGRFGGTCVNYGCTPTKTLVASASAVHTANRGEDFGFSTGGVQVDFARVMQTPQKNRDGSSGWIEEHLKSIQGCSVYKGAASFLDSRTVEVAGIQLTADTIVAHVGTRPRAPDIPGIESVPWLTNESILRLTELPEHLAVVGGSYVALEFAQIFRRLGSRVTVLQRSPRLMSREDEDIGSLIQEFLDDEGVDVRCGSTVRAVSPEQGVTVEYERSAQRESLTASHVLFAIGRVPNSDQLNAKAAGLEMDDHGFIQVDETTRTSQPHIYALGDVNGRGAFTHTSVNDGEIFWDHFSSELGSRDEGLLPERTLDARTPIYCMFTDPPLARVGMDETAARSSGREILISTMPMSRIARAREKRETRGVCKILVDAKSERILGATILGTGGDEVIGTFAAFMQTGASYKRFRRIVFPHPTVSELMPWMLDDLQPLNR